MKVLMVEDSPEIVNVVSMCCRLRWPDCSFVVVAEGAKGIEAAETETPDLIILAINLPDMDGFEVLKQVRLFSDVPIIIINARGDETDQVRALEAGADDYVIKPFNALELIARVNSVLRRSGKCTGNGHTLPPFISGDLSINFQSREVTLRGERVHLTPTEYRILYQLVRNKRAVVSHQAIQQLWGGIDYVDASTVKKYIHQLRTKLGDSTAPPQVILSERGVGYRFVPPQ